MSIPEYPVPNIQWIGSPNYTKKRGKIVFPKSIALHIMTGSLSACDSWFNQTADQNRRVSAHFGVGDSGAIHQYVSTMDTAWGNGILDKPNWRMLAEYPFTSPNALTVSIEHEGNHWEKLTPAEFNSSVRISAHVASKYAIGRRSDGTFNLLAHYHIIGHNQIDSVNRPNCPGASINIEAYTAEVNKLLNAHVARYKNSIYTWYEGFKVADALTRDTDFHAGEPVDNELTIENTTVQIQQGQKRKYLYHDGALYTEILQ